MTHDILIQSPANPNRLVLLFHGYGADAQDLAPIGDMIAQAHAEAAVVSVQATTGCEAGFGWQWMPVQGATDANRATRLQQAMPAFAASVKAWQAHFGVSDTHTALLGFSQGAMMSLAYSQVDGAAPAKVFALSGRFISPPTRVNSGCSIHLFHGEDDEVVAPQGSRDAAIALQNLGAVLGKDLSLDMFSGLGHGIDQRVLRRVFGLL